MNFSGFFSDGLHAGYDTNGHDQRLSSNVRFHNVHVKGGMYPSWSTGNTGSHGGTFWGLTSSSTPSGGNRYGRSSTPRKFGFNHTGAQSETSNSAEDDIRDPPPIIGPDCYIDPDVHRNGQANGAELENGARIESGCEARGAKLDNTLVGSGCDVTGVSSNNSRIFKSRIPGVNVSTSALCAVTGSVSNISASKICNTVFSAVNIDNSTMLNSELSEGNLARSQIHKKNWSAFSVANSVDKDIASLWQCCVGKEGDDHSGSEAPSETKNVNWSRFQEEDENGIWVDV